VTGQALQYDFVDASTVLNGEPEAITGDFRSDHSTHIEYGAQIQLTGPAPYAGLYGFDDEYLGSEGNVSNFGGFSPTHIVFANPLSLGPDPLVEVDWGASVVSDSDTTGFACVESCVILVPARVSLALLGSALGLFLIGSRANRRKAADWARPGPAIRSPHHNSPKFTRLHWTRGMTVSNWWLQYSRMKPKSWR
jgi:hypothetical protein